MQGATGRVIVGVLWLVILVVVAGAWSAGARSASAAAPRPAAPMPAKPVIDTSLRADDAAAAASEHEVDTEAGEPRRDLYGNEIEPAVTDYRVDFYGDVYERQSPDTAILELTAPSL